MTRIKICDTEYSEKLFKPIRNGKIAAWTFCELPALIPLPTLDDPDNSQLEEVRMWVQVPQALITDALDAGTNCLELSGKTISEDGTLITIISFKRCKHFKLDLSYPRNRFVRTLSELYISEDDLEKIRKRPTLLKHSSGPRKKRADAAGTEKLISEALDKLIAAFRHKRSDPSFKALYRSKNGISVSALMNLIFNDGSAYGLKVNRGTQSVNLNSKKEERPIFKYESVIPHNTLRNHLQKRKKSGDLDKLFRPPGANKSQK